MSKISWHFFSEFRRVYVPFETKDVSYGTFIFYEWYFQVFVKVIPKISIILIGQERANIANKNPTHFICRLKMVNWRKICDWYDFDIVIAYYVLVHLCTYSRSLFKREHYCSKPFLFWITDTVVIHEIFSPKYSFFRL